MNNAGKKTIFMFLCFCFFGLICRYSFAEEPLEPQASAEQTESAPQQSQQEDTRPSPAEPQTTAVSEPETLPQPLKKEVTAIEIKGNKSISSNTIISKMKTKAGSIYQENVVNDDLKRLYLLGFFSDINITTEDYNDGIKLIINVTERPLIEKITLSGTRHLRMKEDKLKQSLKSKEGQYLDYPALAEDIEILKKMYEKIGFIQVQTDYKVDINKEANKAKISFNVVEGSKTRIKNILVEGNKAFKDSRILKLIKTKRAWLFNAGVLKEDVLDEDIERIKSFYRKNGFVDVTAEYEITTGTRKVFLYITIKIEEGKKYLVGSIAVRGNNDISERDILEKIKETGPDKVFSLDAVKQDIVNILGLYFDRGYISAHVEEATSVDPATNRVNIVYNITENELTYVDKIKIRGNVKTRDVVIRRELRIKPGDKFDGEKLRRSKERLQNLGFFEEISYDTQDTPEQDKKDLVVEVKETKTGSFSIGGGFSTVEQFVGFVEIEQKNFDWKNFPYFTGAGQDLKFRGSFGTLSSGFDLSFTEPWMFDYPVSFGFDAYKRTHERDTDVGYGYDQDVTGGDIRLGREISEYMRGNFAYRYERIKISNVTATASDLLDEVGINNISSIEFGLSFDSRNNVFDPVRGDYFSNSWLAAGGPFGGDKDFWKYSGRASHYFPMFSDSVFEIRARAGLADTYGNSNKVPIYERFFAGGADTVRGYHERKVGPIDSSKDPLGGEALLIGNLEYRYPVLNFLKLAAFYDVGNVWSKLGDIGSGGFKSGVGAGVRIKTPIGPMVLDYGVPLDKEPGEETKGSGRFHFSMSHGF